MGANFQFLLEDIYNWQERPYFSRDALFWKFMLDGVTVAFYPLLGEIIYLYLMYHKLQSTNPTFEKDHPNDSECVPPRSEPIPMSGQKDPV